MKYSPLQDRLIIRVNIQTETKGGIILSGKSRIKEQVAEVLAVGPGTYTANGDLVPLTVQVGDFVTFPEYTGNKLEDDIWVLRESECLAVVTV